MQQQQQNQAEKRQAQPARLREKHTSVGLSAVAGEGLSQPEQAQRARHAQHDEVCLYQKRDQEAVPERMLVPPGATDGDHTYDGRNQAVASGGDGKEIHKCAAEQHEHFQRQGKRSPPQHEYGGNRHNQKTEDVHRDIRGSPSFASGMRSRCHRQGYPS